MADNQPFNANQWLANRALSGSSLTMSELLWYQQNARLLDLSPRYKLSSRMAGNDASKLKGRGMEFDEVRHYQQGDDIRTIDWRVTARTGKTHTKLFREETERPVFVLLDLSESMKFGTKLLFKSVLAAHLASMIGWAAVNRGDRIGALLFNNNTHRELKPRNRKPAVLAMLHQILDLHQSEQQHNFSLTDACLRMRRLAKPGALVFVISDFNRVNDECFAHLQSISRHCELSAWHISDPIEHSLPRVRAPRQLAVEHQQQAQIVTLGDEQTETSYRQQQSQHRQYVQEQLTKCRCSVNQLTSALPLEHQLNGSRAR